MLLLNTQRTTNLHRNAVFVLKGRESPESFFSSYQSCLHFKPWWEGAEMRATFLARLIPYRHLKENSTLLTATVAGPVTHIFCTSSWVAFNKKNTVKRSKLFSSCLYRADARSTFNTAHLSFQYDNIHHQLIQMWVFYMKNWFIYWIISKLQ